MKRTKTARRIVSGLLSVVMTSSLILFAVNAYHPGRALSDSAAHEESEPSASGRSDSGSTPVFTNRNFLHAADADLSIGTSERHMLYQSQDADLSQMESSQTDGADVKRERSEADQTAKETNEKEHSDGADAKKERSEADQTAKETNEKEHSDGADAKKERSEADQTAKETNEKEHLEQEEKEKKQKKQETDKQQYHTFQTVSPDYFSDALFIGDSRTVGMCQSHLLPQASYYAKTGIGIGNILTDRIVNEGGVMISVPEALSRHSFGKVYIMIGINDIARGDVEWFTEQYKKILTTVRSTQPDAVIYIQGNIPMSYRTQDLDGALNNRNLSLRDNASKELADSESVFYLDIGSIYADANGHLASAYTRDGLHVCTDDYPLWVDYLLHHAIVRT